MEWDEYAATWDADEAVWAYADAALASLSDEADRRGFEIGGTRVLDFGCGTGQLTERLVGSCRWIDAVDSSPAMLAVLQAKITERGWNHVRTLSEIPGGDPVYDLIVCSSVCSFLDDYPGTVVQLRRLLRTGGLFVQWDWELDPTQDDPHGLTRERVRSVLTGAGLTFVTVDSAFEVTVGQQSMCPLLGVGRQP